MIVTSAKLAETRILYTERFVFKINVLAAALLVGGLSIAGSSAVVGRPLIGEIDTSKNGGVSVAEMKTAGVIE